VPFGSWKISDYITAVATSATAVFAWLAYRYALNSTYPIVECDEPQWINETNTISIRVVVRNRSAIDHTLSFVEVRKPSDSTLRLAVKPPIVSAKKLDLSWSLRSVGTRGDDSIIGTTDQVTLRLVLEPPTSFLAGKLRIVVAISDKSIRPRQRRLVISKFIHAAKAKITADTVNKID
jgi:hypothetical protein